METDYENQSNVNKAKSTLGYGIMWLFVSFLVGILPFYVGNGYKIFFITGGLSLLTGVYMVSRGFSKILSLKNS